MKTKQKRWQHVSGGTNLIGKMQYPCDDEYEDRETGRIVTVKSTEDAHFNRMPESVDRITDLKKIKGVKLARKDRHKRAAAKARRGS